MCTKMTNLTSKTVRYNRVFVYNRVRYNRVSLYFPFSKLPKIYFSKLFLRPICFNPDWRLRPWELDTQRNDVGLKKEKEKKSIFSFKSLRSRLNTIKIMSCLEKLFVSELHNSTLTYYYAINRVVVTDRHYALNEEIFKTKYFLYRIDSRRVMEAMNGLVLSTIK